MTMLMSGNSIHACSSPEMNYNLTVNCFNAKNCAGATDIYCHHFDEICTIVSLFTFVVNLRLVKINLKLET